MIAGQCVEVSEAPSNEGMEPTGKSVTPLQRKEQGEQLIPDVRRHGKRQHQLFYIAESNLAAQYYDELQQRFRKEWPEMQPVDTAGQTVPKPVVAVTASGAIAGGLAFAVAKAPLSEAPAIWINAVLVDPAYRRSGLGSQLILAAQESAGRLGISRLYALTELPALYSKLTWAILSSSGADFIMAWDSHGVV